MVYLRLSKHNHSILTSENGFIFLSDLLQSWKALTNYGVLPINDASQNAWSEDVVNPFICWTCFILYY